MFYISSKYRPSIGRERKQFFFFKQMPSPFIQ